MKKQEAILPISQKADEEDYETEFLDLILAIRVVNHLGKPLIISKPMATVTPRPS